MIPCLSFMTVSGFRLSFISCYFTHSIRSIFQILPPLKFTSQPYPLMAGCDCPIMGESFHSSVGSAWNATNQDPRQQYSILFFLLNFHPNFLFLVIQERSKDISMNFVISNHIYNIPALFLNKFEWIYGEY